jgi:SIR2-like domain
MTIGRDHGPKPIDTDPYLRRSNAPDANFSNFLNNWKHYRGKLVLFLGAGASVGARAAATGRPLPTAYHLRNLIWRTFMSDESPEFTPEQIQLVSLEHAAALAERCSGRAALLQLLATSFQIDVPLWQHAVLPFLEPAAVFSPNFDSLIEEGWRLHATNTAVGRLRPYYRDENRDATPHVPLYKPHGTLERLHEPVGEGGLVITQFDYISMLTYRREALNKCLDDLNSACVVFIGYSFQDLDIATALYAMRNPQDKRRIPWYAVFPRNDETVRNMYDERYGIRQISRTFFEFLVELDEAVDFVPAQWKIGNLHNLPGVYKPQPKRHIEAEAGKA